MKNEWLVRGAFSAGAGGAGGALALAGAPASPEPRAALILGLAALGAVLFAPWRAAAAAEGGASPWRRALKAAGETLPLLVGAGAVGLAAGCPAGGLLHGLAYVLALALFLAGAAAAAGARVGQPLATGLGLLLLALPYAAGPAAGVAGEELLLARVLDAPLCVLAGSCADFDLLRSDTLYQLFPPGQGLPYAYASAWEVRGWTALLAGLGLVLPLLPRVAGRRPGAAGAPRLARAALAPAAVVAVLLGTADAVRAQESIFQPTRRGGGEEEVGDVVTRVKLGYYVPHLDGFARLDGNDGSRGDRLSYNSNLDLDPIFVVPTFAVGFSWDNAGALQISYAEAEWQGETQTTAPLQFEEATIRARNRIDTKYKWRTIALRGELDVPAFEWATLQIITTQRYVKHEIKLQAFPDFFSGRDSTEMLLPTIGAGAEVYLYDIITAYGDIQWLDFRTNIFGGKEDRLDLRYREWRAGVRLELVEHAHVMVEWYSIRTLVREGRRPGRKTYEHEVGGVRLQVAVLF